MLHTVGTQKLAQQRSELIVIQQITCRALIKALSFVSPSSAPTEDLWEALYFRSNILNFQEDAV